MRRLVFVAGALMIGVAAPLAAQGRWSLEVNGGAAIPVAKLAGTELETGFGFGAAVEYRFMPHLGVYSGWEWNKLQAETLLPGGKVDVEETGYTFGLRFAHPLAGRTGYWLRAGGTYKHLEIEDGAGDLIEDTGHGMGFEAGAGLSVPIGARVSLTPGVRYRSVARDMDMIGRANLRYISVGAGLIYVF